MPFDESFDELYQEVLKECLEETNFNVIRADELYGSKPIMEDILNRIESSEIVVADLTGRNPNVFYELGIAHCRKENDNLIIITQELDDVPFDLKPYRIIKYQPTISGAKALKKQLKNTILEFRLKSFTWSSHEWQPLTEYWCTYDDGDTLRAEIFRRGQIPIVFNRTQMNGKTTSISFTAQSTSPEINVMFYCDDKNRYSGYHFWFWQGGAKLRRLDNEVKLETGYKLRQDTQHDIIIKYNDGEIEVFVDKNSVLSFSDENPLHENKRLNFMGFNIASRIGHVNFYDLEIIHE
jgi:hypothetical protein